MKKLMALLLAAAMVLSLAACGGSSAPAATTAPAASNGDAPASNDAPAAIDADVVYEREEDEDAVYDRALGEFNTVYQDAKSEITDLDMRMAKMAIAEAKLMESGVFIPVYGDGGNYAMTRAVPRTVTTTSWGIDEYKWYTMLVANELITAEDRTALIALWGEAADQAEWMTSAKAFLADHGYTLTDTYNALTGYELATWDVIATSFTSDSYFISCTYSPLLEYDSKNVQQPALATSYDVNEDGTVYTFHLREGVKWVDNQGREIAEVTAQDWVTSMMHLVDNADALGYLMTVEEGCGIKNFDAYMNGDIVDFSEVGVKALDKYTLEYTLEAPFPPFVTMMGYACFAPLNYEFYKSQGGTFSAEGDEYTSGKYGTTPETIAYNGAYLVTNYTEKNVYSYTANPTYWNADAVNVHNVNFYFNDGSDTLRAYNDAKAGTVAGAGFNSSAVEMASQETVEGTDKTYMELYGYTTTNSATTYCGWVNMNRGAFANYNDNTVGISPASEMDKVRTHAALNNTNFRVAMALAFDRGAYNSTIVGESLKYAALKNSYITGNFQKTVNEVTVDINGTPTTFPAGTYFGEVEQAQLDADGFPIKVWDPEGDGGAGSGDGFDGWFSVENANKFMEQAIAELAAEGVEVSTENPIIIDAPYGTYSESLVNRMQAYKQSVENSLGGLVKINLVGFDSSSNFTYAYYRTTCGAEANYDITPGTSGWGPDYGDAQTFLDTIQPYGYMTKNLGLF